MRTVINVPGMDENNDWILQRVLASGSYREYWLIYHNMQKHDITKAP